jgi:hypothetical protein
MARIAHMIRLQIPTLEALTHSEDYWGRVQWGISCILPARAYLDLLAFHGSFPPEFMRSISITARCALELFFSSSHEYGFRMSNCYMMVVHRVLELSPKGTSHARTFPRCNEAPIVTRGFGSS